MHLIAGAIGLIIMGLLFKELRIAKIQKQVLFNYLDLKDKLDELWFDENCSVEELKSFIPICEYIDAQTEKFYPEFALKQLSTSDYLMRYIEELSVGEN